MFCQFTPFTVLISVLVMNTCAPPVCDMCIHLFYVSIPFVFRPSAIMRVYVACLRCRFHRKNGNPSSCTASFLLSPTQSNWANKNFNFNNIELKGAPRTNNDDVGDSSERCELSQVDISYHDIWFSQRSIIDVATPMCMWNVLSQALYEILQGAKKRRLNPAVIGFRGRKPVYMSAYSRPVKSVPGRRGRRKTLHSTSRLVATRFAKEHFEKCLFTAFSNVRRLAAHLSVVRAWTIDVQIFTWRLQWCHSHCKICLHSWSSNYGPLASFAT